MPVANYIAWAIYAGIFLVSPRKKKGILGNNR